MTNKFEKLIADLKHKIEAKKAEGRTPRAVFDLDGTLIYYFPRTKQILIDAARMVPKIPESTIKNIESLDLDDFPYWLNNLLDDMAIDDQQVKEAFLKDWDDRFFTDQYLWADKAMKYSCEFVQRLTDAGVVISYLTGRHRNGMYLGTKASIIKNGFPFYDGDLGILMKPLKEYSNAEFKRDAAEKLASSKEVVAIFDNEPRELDYIAGNLPDAIPVLYISPHSSEYPLSDRAYRIQDYMDLIKAWDKK